MSDPDSALDELLEKEFADLQEQHYPGSKKSRRTVPEPEPVPDEQRWDARPKTLKVSGKEHEFFTIGAVAKAINRQIVSVRMWERKGIIPKARYRTKKGDRLYSRRQVEGLIEICRKHGLLSFNARPEAGSITKAFTMDVIALWKEPLG